jgi:hypothetical protein
MVRRKEALDDVISVASPRADVPKQTCRKDIGCGFGGDTLGKHDYREIEVVQFIHRRREKQMTHGMHKQLRWL